MTRAVDQMTGVGMPGERLIVALALLLGGAALLPAALAQRDAAMGVAFDPSFFPLIVLGGWVLLAALAVLDAVRAAPGDTGEGVRWLPVLGAALGMLAFALLFRRLGFFIGGAALSVLVLWLSGRIGWRAMAVFALLVPGGLVALFNHILKMPLPNSPFVWWL